MAEWEAFRPSSADRLVAAIELLITIDGNHKETTFSVEETGRCDEKMAWRQVGSAVERDDRPCVSARQADS